ncbi:hypothetical protein [Rariglobus hedericola]|uniref:Uncharacterized protein n=1 Tax=Rariglobus hedericola TaxID=2597822 RepID=A0A556QJ83_9BACT|nr:hypothetical protein [Rariglobus hedericola]TSJ76715.1 hypothetical protein FPL22_11355 [Rariglobus hedericola]
MAEPSAKLDELLLDDCHVRYALGLLKELHGDFELRVKAIQQSFSSRTRFLPTIGRSDELAAHEAARAELARVVSAQETMERLHPLIAEGLAGELDNYVRLASPAYLRGLAAIDNLTAWPALLERLHAKLDELLRALVEARNMAASGYDWQRGRLSPAANEAIDRALLVAHQLDEEVNLVNSRADRHQMEILDTPQAAALLPRMPVVGFQVRIERVRTLIIAEVQAEFNRITEMLALLEETGIAGLREATDRVAVVHRESSQAYLQTYLGQLRAHMDEHRLVPTETTARIHRLQAKYLGGVNFPFDLG